MPLFVPRSASDHSSSPPLSCWKKSLPFLLLKAGLSQGGLPPTLPPPHQLHRDPQWAGKRAILDRAGHQPWPAPILGCCRGLRGVSIDQMGSNARHDHSLALIRTWPIFPAPSPMVYPEHSPHPQAGLRSGKGSLLEGAAPSAPVAAFRAIDQPLQKWLCLGCSGEADLPRPAPGISSL